MNFYVRDTEGATFHVESLTAGLKHLTGPTGCRLTISEGQTSESTEIVIRAGEFVPSLLGLPEVECYDSSLVVRIK